MTELSDKERALAEALWESIPQQASVVLGVDIELGKMKFLDELPELGTKFHSTTLTTERSAPVDMLLVFEDRTAIAFSGLLVMMLER